MNVLCKKKDKCQRFDITCTDASYATGRICFMMPTEATERPAPSGQTEFELLCVKRVEKATVITQECLSMLRKLDAPTGILGPVEILLDVLIGEYDTD
ncbi:MAG: hypothetical protein KAS32_05825 [Candidatus Peribacteraceae bacterium]|nr:hypothetical protein [Candidatus Peribacteraceae bacterium]